MDGDEALVDAVVEQVFETALLQDGIHPDPSSMADRLTLLMQAATGSASADLPFAEVKTVISEPAADRSRWRFRWHHARSGRRGQ